MSAESLTPRQVVEALGYTRVVLVGGTVAMIAPGSCIQWCDLDDDADVRRWLALHVERTEHEATKLRAVADEAARDANTAEIVRNATRLLVGKMTP